MFLLLVHLFVDPLEDQEADATDPDPSPARGRAHVRAHPHQPTSDAEAQEGTHMAVVIVIVTLSAAGPTVVVVHLDATCTDQIVLVHVLARLFAEVIQRDPHLLEGARRVTLAVDMDVAGPEVTRFALAVLAADPSRVHVHVPVPVLCPTQAILDTLEAGAAQGLLVEERGAEAAMTLEIAGRGRPLSLKVERSSYLLQICGFILFLLWLNSYLLNVVTQQCSLR